MLKNRETTIVRVRLLLTDKCYCCFVGLFVSLRNSSSLLSLSFFKGNRWMNTIPLSSNLSSRRSATGASVDKEGTANQHVLKDYLKRRNLILALVRREIERLSTWHNPLAQLDLNFTGLELLVTWANQTVFTERSWRDLVRLAWHISPDIAVFLPARCV